MSRKTKQADEGDEGKGGGVTGREGMQGWRFAGWADRQGVEHPLSTSPMSCPATSDNEIISRNKLLQ